MGKKFDSFARGGLYGRLGGGAVGLCTIAYFRMTAPTQHSGQLSDGFADGIRTLTEITGFLFLLMLGSIVGSIISLTKSSLPRGTSTPKLIA